jgi:hypothetical protein
VVVVVVVVVVAATPNYLRQASQNLGKYIYGAVLLPRFSAQDVGTLLPEFHRPAPYAYAEVGWG